MSKIEDGLILTVGVGMMSIFEWMRMDNDNPVLYVRMGETCDSTPINGEEDKEEEAQ